ncbi:pseudouridine synthase [Desulfonatronovibrio magnus]|uniref:pseudouridine synthase n=1 Tax=Desulfonatronovibrio magnus TaxID=698827 RepID=UPI000697C2AE|nr:RluA family pseudouridine synthase [Desulfonatronovibrio magnus]
MKTSSQVKYYEVSEQESGQKLFSYLQRKLGRDIPRSAIMKFIRTGQVRVNKGRCKPFQRVCAADEIRVPPHSSSAKTDTSDAGPIDIIYESHEYLVLDKPPGLPVHPGTYHNDSLVTRVHAAYSHAVFAPTPAHRLDKNTTGIILFAKSYKWLRYIQSIWNQPGFCKEYLAWVQGKWDANIAEIKAGILKDHLGARVDSRGKEARSSITVVAGFEDMSLLRVRIYTGRTHQIRLHLAQKGHPIIGDTEHTDKECKTMYLHSFRLNWGKKSFTHLPDWEGRFNPELYLSISKSELVTSVCEYDQSHSS